MKLKRSSETSRLIFSLNFAFFCNFISRIIVKRPKMLSAEFVVLYKHYKPKPCKPKLSFEPFGTNYEIWARLKNFHGPIVLKRTGPNRRDCK